MARLRCEYDDILEPRRVGSDIRFGLQTLRGVPEYRHMKKQTPHEVKEHVLKSQRLRHVIEELVSEKGVEPEVVYKEADAILVEMGHNLNMTNLRCLAVIFSKVFQQLFQHVYVNPAGIQKMKTRMRETPVVLLPTHRSYLDFLLMSYILFHYHLPLPVIAAGADFMHMKFVGEILRRAGAFYIRRSFGSDKLYWAIFTEYTQVTLVNGEAPIEFFVEGTRSRIGKFLSPKLGLLSVVVEPFLKGKVTDVTLVPISISYDRIVEEKLHAQEMLGTPKPKESTSGLVKARKIFQEDFGNITVHFCDPISLRDHLSSLDRSAHNLSPRFLFSLVPEEQQAIENIAHEVQQIQRDHIILSPWTLCAACLMQRPDMYVITELTREVVWLRDMVSQYGVQVRWPGGSEAQLTIQTNLGVHQTLVRHHRDGRLTFNRSLYDNSGSVDTSTIEGVLTHAAVHVNVAMYRNYLAASMAVYGTLSLAFCGLEQCRKDELFAQYEFMAALLSEEFPSQPKGSHQRFESVLAKLVASGAVDVSRDDIRITAKGEREMAFLTGLMSPFLLGYWLVCQHLMAHPSPPQGVSLKQTAKDIQLTIATIVSQGKLHHYEVLSLNLLTNALTALIQMGIVLREKSTNGAIISWTTDAVSRVADKIGEFIQLPVGVPLSVGDMSVPAKL
ncbi:dihydroxyacetone phosphate acyltransferase-like [Diadema antillarum]|uniref:dihydroxyacetone phosphate acyltransferase-like n=1 Tax=Diadema antillarum TaxID=105358 RepID=UPI003A84DF78